MLGVSVNVRGDAEFMAKLGKLGTTLFEWEGALEETGKNLQAYFGEQVFQSQGGALDTVGTPWKALSASTVAQKSLHYRQYAAVPLMRTGAMSTSFDHKAGPLHLEVTNNAPYFKYHQSTLPRKKIPRRPMMAINRDVKSIIRSAFHKAMLEKMAGL